MMSLNLSKQKRGQDYRTLGVGSSSSGSPMVHIKEVKRIQKGEEKKHFCQFTIARIANFCSKKYRASFDSQRQVYKSFDTQMRLFLTRYESFSRVPKNSFVVFKQAEYLKVIGSFLGNFSIVLNKLYCKAINTQTCAWKVLKAK